MLCVWFTGDKLSPGLFAINKEVEEEEEEEEMAV